MLKLILSPSSGSTSGASSSSSAAATVTLTFWGTYGNGGNKTQTDALNQTIIPAFEKANPGIKVDYVDIPYDSMLQKLTTSAAGGQLPETWCARTLAGSRSWAPSASSPRWTRR